MNLLVKSKTIYRSARKFEKKISAYSGQIAPVFDMDCIHDFRTSVKKIRALLRWSGKDRQKLTRGSKCLYSIAGEIRNAQVMYGHLDEMGVRPAGLAEWLGLHLALLEGQWSHAYSPSKWKKLRKKIRKCRFKRTDEEGLDDWLSEKQGEARMLLIDPTLPDEQLHEVRKIYKDMQYVLEWYGKNEDDTRQERLDEIKRISSVAGDFNDKRVGLSLLYMYRQEWHAGSDQEAGKIILEWEEEKRQKRSALLALLDEDIHASH